MQEDILPQCSPLFSMQFPNYCANGWQCCTFLAIITKHKSTLLHTAPMNYAK